MVDISKINTNNRVSFGNRNLQKESSKPSVEGAVSGEKSGVYPSGSLLKVMCGVVKKSNSQADKNAQIEQINGYLHSLPLVGKVVNAFEQDEEGKSAVKGLINAMQKNDVEASNVEMLIDLVESRRVNCSALLYLCNQGIMSDDFEKDLDTMYDAHINKKDVKEAFVPTLKSVDEALQKRETGDVFSVDGQDKIYIKTSESESKQLDLTKNTYLKLFPPLERFALYQGDAGNCYMLSTLDAINSNPKSREKILSCFHENGDNLSVSLPDSDYVFTMNKNKLPDEIKQFREQYSVGAAGFKILEHVYGKDVQEHLTKDAHEILKEQSQNAKGFFTKKMFKKQLSEFEKALAENPDNIAIERKLSDQSVSWNTSVGVEWNKLNEVTTDFKRASDYYRGRGGHEEWVMQRFGFENIEKVFDLDTKNAGKMKDLLFNPENQNEYIFTACSADKNGTGSQVEGLVNEDYGVYSRHSFSVKPSIDKDGNKVLHVSNPWNSTQSSVMSYEKFCELFTFVVAAKV